MHNQDTIPSQLGPVDTIPAPLSSVLEPADPPVARDAGSGLGLKMAFAAIGVALLVYVVR